MNLFEKFVVLIVSLFLLNFGCKEKPSEAIKEGIKPSKRDFMWTVDTLFYHPYGQTLLQSIWGSSPTNVYAVGHDAHAGIATMWHYNGKQWKYVDLLPYYGGNIEGPFDLSIVFGFDSTNIYAAGNRVYQTFSNKPPYFLDSTFIIHFDGTTWKEIKIERRFGILSKFGALFPSNIWCAGYGKYIYHFNGSKWELDSIPYFYNDSTYSLNINSIELNPNGSVILLSNVHNNSNGLDIYKIFQKFMSQWVELDSFTNKDTQKWGTTNLWKDSDGNIYSCSDAIYVLQKDAWHEVFRSQYSVVKLWGTSKNNIFALSGFGVIHHFNGINWAKLDLPASSNIGFYGVWGTEEEIFLSAHDGNKTYMFHGK